jgi:hypothetical protein
VEIQVSNLLWRVFAGSRFGAANQQIGSALTAAFQLQGHSDRHFGALVNFLYDKRMLIVLDNCEHVIEEAAHLVEALLRSAPSRKREVAMLFHVHMIIRIPHPVGPEQVQQLTAKEHERATELEREGKWLGSIDVAIPQNAPSGTVSTHHLKKGPRYAQHF